jgi:hypothetical protein
MNAFRNIDALLRVIAREKELIKFLFTGRKAPSLRPEQAMEHFLEGDERRLNLLLDHGVIRKNEEGGVLVLEETYLRFFEEVLEVNEEINVQSVKQHIDALNENIELWLTAGTDPQRFRYMGEILRILRNISLSTHRNVIDLKRNIDSTYKNERDYALKRKRLEILDRKRADIALLIKEAEKVIENAPLKETLTEVKTSLTESYHNLLELDRQIIQYLNKIEAEQKLVEKIRRIKYLKDQLVWEQSTDVLFCLQTHRPAFLEKRPWYNFLPSLELITNSSDGLAALKEAHKALKHPVAKRKVETEPLTAEETVQRTLVQDTMNTYEIRNAFLGSSQDLMSFLATGKEFPLSEKLSLFCRLAAEYYEDFRITDQYVEMNDYSYPLIYPR